MFFYILVNDDYTLILCSHTNFVYVLFWDIEWVTIYGERNSITVQTHNHYGISSPLDFN